MTREEIKFFIWRFRVCLAGMWRNQHWVWNNLSGEDWRDTYEWGYSTPDEAYLEVWCRD